MRLTTVTVARLVNTGNYENFRVEMTAELQTGDDVQAAAADLARAIARAIAAEQVRRFPSADDRRWHTWLDEEQAPLMAAPPDRPGQQ